MIQLNVGKSILFVWGRDLCSGEPFWKYFLLAQVRMIGKHKRRTSDIIIKPSLINI